MLPGHQGEDDFLSLDRLPCSRGNPPEGGANNFFLVKK